MEVNMKKPKLVDQVLKDKFLKNIYAKILDFKSELSFELNLFYIDDVEMAERNFNLKRLKLLKDLFKKEKKEFNVIFEKALLDFDDRIKKLQTHIEKRKK